MTGINIYTYGLCFLVIVQFLIGFIHIILLYNTYRPILMNNCIQRQPYRFFWWSENYAENERFKETFDHCYNQWTQFSTERLVSWVVYSVASGLILTVVILHKLRISNEYKQARGYIVSNQEGEWLPTEKPTNDSTIPPPPYGDEISKEMADMHQQRQKLYEEIDKRKRARKSLNRRSTISNADVIHPLDLSKKDAYQPPPMPSKDRRESWNRYEGHSQEDPVRNRLDSLTSERLDYELYKSNEPQVRRRHSSFGERKRRMSTRRRSRLGDSQRKQSARWSNAYNDKMPLIASSNDVEEENDDEKEENERLMKSD
ncbi:hypothetical protein G6F61_007920 [Rhizopus arrhizus]|nr:hypothetical protein G6F61_007920 [Rhizopus arrhizus]